jgi:TonB-linked SusC/RagA family outer membrane protein
MQRTAICQARLYGTFFAFWLSVLLSLSAVGQETRFTFHQLPLETVFKTVEQKTAYRFVYAKEELSDAKPVTLDVKSTDIGEILKRIFQDQPLSYSLNKQYVSVFRKEPVTGTSSATLQLIEGRVVNESATAIARATVQIKGTAVATSTTEEGLFRLSSERNRVVLQVSSVGYRSVEVIATSGEIITVQLQTAVTALDETIVIAYGSTTRRLSTGNISKVSAEQLGTQPVANPLQALQGRVAGLQITQSSGVPGSSFKVEIRGQTSLDLRLSRNDPLFVIDGVPFEAGNVPLTQLTSAANYNSPILSGKQGGLSPLNAINPANIESIEVLKDADATAIYGSRGASGVILITTKKGKAGKAQFTVDVNTGFSQVTRSMPMLTTVQYREMRREAFFNDGLAPTITNAPDLLLWDSTRQTDLRKWLTGGTALATNVNTVFSGGSQTTNFSISSGYRRETTVYPEEFWDQRATANVSLQHRTIDNRLRLSFSGGYSNGLNNLTATDLTSFVSLPPNLLLYDNAGRPAWSEGGVNFSSLGIISTPAAELLKSYRSKTENLLSNLRIEFEVLPRLRIKTNFGYHQTRNDETATLPMLSKNPSTGTLASSDFAHTRMSSRLIEPQIEYNYQKGNNRLLVLVGGTWQVRHTESEILNARNYVNDQLLNSLAAAGTVSASNNESEYRYVAFFGRISYTLKESYLLTLSARRDGSSRFGPERQTASFGAIGAGWIFSQSTFFKKKAPFVSHGKIRGSYGVTGNDQIGDYKYLNLWSSTSQPYQGMQGLRPTALFNPDYNWERNKKLEGGLEIGLWQDRVFFSFAYYRNRSSNQLISYNLPLQTGFGSVVKNLDALVQNSGLEIEATSRILTGSFGWTVQANATIPRNRLVRFPGLASSSYAKVYQEGQSLNLIYGYRYLGVNPTTGVYGFEDVNKDGQVNFPSDYQLLGNRDGAIFGGLLNTLRYKGWQLDIFIEGKKQKGLTYLASLAGNPPGFAIYNQPQVVLERWQKPGDNAPVQQFSQGTGAPFQAVFSYLPLSDGIYGNASYIRLKNVALSFQPSAALLSKWGLQQLKLYLQGQNLATLTKYRGSDPETQNLSVLPPLRTIVAGILLHF